MPGAGDVVIIDERTLATADTNQLKDLILELGLPLDSGMTPDDLRRRLLRHSI